MKLYQNLIKKYKEKIKEKKFKKKYLNKQFIGYKIKNKKIISYYIQFKKKEFFLYEEDKLICNFNKFKKIKEEIIKNKIISDLVRK